MDLWYAHANLLQTCYGEIGVMDFGLYAALLYRVKTIISSVLSYLDCTANWRRSSSERPWKNASKFMHRTARSEKNLKKYHFRVNICTLEHTVHLLYCLMSMSPFYTVVLLCIFIVEILSAALL